MVPNPILDISYLLKLEGRDPTTHPTLGLYIPNKKLYHIVIDIYHYFNTLVPIYPLFPLVFVYPSLR